MKRVTAPDGREWTVRRRWAPKVARQLGDRASRHARRLRHAGRPGDAADVAFAFDELAPAIGIFFLVLLGLAFLVTGLPLLIDVLAVIVFGIGGAVARMVFRRPWTIEAVTGEHRVERQVVGLRQAGEEVALLAHAIEHGQVR